MEGGVGLFPFMLDVFTHVRENLKSLEYFSFISTIVMYYVHQ